MALKIPDSSCVLMHSSPHKGFVAKHATFVWLTLYLCWTFNAMQDFFLPLLTTEWLC